MKKSYSKKEQNQTKSFLIGTSVILFIFLFVSFAVALIAYSGENPTSNVNLLSLISFLISAAASGFINIKRSAPSEFKAPIFSAVLFLAIFFIVSAVSCGSVTLSSLMNILSFLLIYLFFTFAGKKKSGKRHTKRR